MREAVIYYLMRRGQTHHAAEDIAQETCARLLRYCEDQRPASLYALAFRIAGNCLVDAIRKDGPATDEVAETLACEEPAPDRVVHGKQRLQLFQDALQAMPKLRRTVFVKRRVEGRSHAQIAEEIGISVASVEKHVSRGLQDLRLALARHDGEAEV